MSSTSVPLRNHVLNLYRAFMREARQMPTANRREFIVKKARHEFKLNKGCQDEAELKDMVYLAEIQLDNVTLQRSHLNQLKKEGKLKC